MKGVRAPETVWEPLTKRGETPRHLTSPDVQPYTKCLHTLKSVRVLAV